MVDVSGSEGRDPIDDFEKINRELLLYSERVAKKPMLVAANKIDMIDEDSPQYLRFKAYVEKRAAACFRLLRRSISVYRN